MKIVGVVTIYRIVYDVMLIYKGFCYKDAGRGIGILIGRDGTFRNWNIRSLVDS